MPAAKKSSSRNAPSSDRKLRLAIIGTGMIAGSHITALQKMKNVEIVGLADIKKAALDEKVDKFSLPREICFTDYEKMLDKVQPDAVSVCTPNGVHAPASIAASQAGAHVIVEKPMAMNAQECRRMIAAAKKARRKLVIGFQYRFDPKTQFLKQVANDGVLGDVMYGRVQAMRRRGIPNWGVFGRKELQGGGPMIDIGVHVLEMCHYTMGAPQPIAATGMTRTYLGHRKSNIKSAMAGWDYKTYTVEDLAVGHIQFDNGAVIHVEAMFAGHIEKDTWDFTLMGEKGGCSWADTRVFTDDHGHMVNVAPAWLPQSNNFQQFFDLKLRDFVDHVLYDKPTMAPAEHGLMVQQMLDAVYRSAEQGGKQVKIEKLV